MGLAMSGSEATSWISKPGGRWKDFCSSWGVRGGVERTFSAKGSAAYKDRGSRITNRIILRKILGLYISPIFFANFDPKRSLIGPTAVPVSHFCIKKKRDRPL